MMTMQSTHESPRARAVLFYDRFYAGCFGFSPFLIIALPRLAAFIVPLFAVSFFIGFCAVHKKLPYFSWKVFMLPCVLSALMLGSTLWAEFPHESLHYSLKMVPIIFSGGVLVMLAQQVGTDERHVFRRLFPLAVLCGGAVCAVDLYGHGLVYHLLNGDHERFTTSKPNRAVVIFVFCSLMALPLLLRCRTFCTGRQAVFLAALSLAILYQTDSQSAQLGFMAGLLIYALFPVSQRLAWQALIGGLAVFLLAAPFIAQEMFHTLPTYANESGWLKSGYAASRMEIWDFVSRRALQRPFTGFGVEATRMITDFDTAKLYHPDTKVMHPHNFILQLWIEFGVWGAVLAAGFFGWLLYRLQQFDPRMSRLVLPVFCAAILIGAMTYGLWQGWWIGLIGLLMVYATLILKEAENPAPLK